MKKRIEKNGQTYGISLNYFKASWNRPSGYYLTVTPVTVEKHVGYETETFIITDMKSRLILQADRRSKKQAEKAEQLTPEWIELMIEKSEREKVQKNILLKLAK